MRTEVERVCSHCSQVRETSAYLLKWFQVCEKEDLKAPSSVTAAGSSISGCFCTLPWLPIAKEEALVLVVVGHVRGGYGKITSFLINTLIGQLPPKEGTNEAITSPKASPTSLSRKPSATSTTDL